MRKVIPAILATAALSSAACSRGGSSIGPVTAPTPVAQTQPPAVNLNGTGTQNGQPIQVSWNGDVSFDQQTGSNTMGLQLLQTGAQVSGQLSLFGPDGGGGPIAGTVSGNTLIFNFSVGNQGQGCGNTASGTAIVGTNTMTGTFSGKRCNGQSYTNGTFTLHLPSTFQTSPFPVAGRWTATVPTPLGGGVWTFSISEAPVDVNSSNVSGSVAVTGGTLNLGSGSLTGPVTDTYPGPTTIARMTVMFAGPCATNVVVNVGILGGNPGFDGHQMTGGVSGTTCNGSLPQGLGVNLFKQ